MESLKPPFTIKYTPRFMSVNRFIRKVQFEINNLLKESGTDAIIDPRSYGYAKIEWCLTSIFYDLQPFSVKYAVFGEYEIHSDLLPYVIAIVFTENPEVAPDEFTNKLQAYYTEFMSRELTEGSFDRWFCKFNNQNKKEIYRTPFYPEQLKYERLVKLVQRELIRVSNLINRPLFDSLKNKVSYYQVDVTISQLKDRQGNPILNEETKQEVISIQLAKVITYGCILKRLRYLANYNLQMETILLNEKDFHLVFKKFPTFLMDNQIDVEELIQRKVIVFIKTQN